jgi:transcription initiation factor IIE alpha subunit
MADYIRFCPHCHLPYRPDERIYTKNPNEYCPKCGFRLVEDDNGNEEEVEDG